MKNLKTKSILACAVLASVLTGGFVFGPISSAMAAGVLDITGLQGGGGASVSRDGKYVAADNTKTIYFGNYWQTAVAGYNPSGIYIKPEAFNKNNWNYEPIKWRVLDNNTVPSPESSGVLITADLSLYADAFNIPDTKGNIWGTSDVRDTMNSTDKTQFAEDGNVAVDSTGNKLWGGFAGDAFNDKEYEAIAETTHTGEGTFGGRDKESTEKIFLLSVDEATNKAYGFSDNRKEVSDTRKVSASQMSEHVNMYGNDSVSVTQNGHACNWWLRSPGYLSYDTFGIGDNGYVFTGAAVDSFYDSVRTSLNLNQDSILLVSAAEATKSDGTNYDKNSKSQIKVGDGFAVEDYDGKNGWKLTVYDKYDADENPTGIKTPTINYAKITGSFDVNDFAYFANITGSKTMNIVGSEQVAGPEEFSVSYSDATTGTDMYVSALLYDETGTNILNYAKIADASGTEEGTVTIDHSTLSALDPGRYQVAFFGEQVNDDYQTDYASELSSKYQFTIYGGDGKVETMLKSDYANDGLTANLSNNAQFDFEGLKYDTKVNVGTGGAKITAVNAVLELAELNANDNTVVNGFVNAEKATIANGKKITANGVFVSDKYVAIGNGSEATEANTVSVGSSDLKRRIVNVAPGTADNDAVNLAQMNAAIANAGGTTYTAGDNVSISDEGVISATDTTYTADNTNITIGEGNKITLAQTLTGLTSVSTGTLTTTGNVTVGGTLGVTGALTGSTATFSGAVTAASLTVDNVELTGTKITGYDTHVANNDIHVTAEQKTAWDAKQGALSTEQLAAANSGITSTKVSGYDTHVANSDIHVTAEQKTAWTNKQDKLTAGTNVTIASDGTISATDTTYTGDGTNITIGEGNKITLAQTLTGLTSVSTGTLTTTGNVTVGGTLGVTGALSGSTATFSGAVTAASLTVDNVELTGTKITGYDTHVANNDIHVTKEQKTAWDAKQGALTDAQLAAADSGITSEKVGSYDTHVANNDIHVTAEQKTAWDAKQDKLTAGNNIVIADDGKTISLKTELTGLTSAVFSGQVTAGTYYINENNSWTSTGIKASSIMVGSNTYVSSNGLNANSQKITNVANPTDNADAANKDYVDTAVSGVSGNVTTLAGRVTANETNISNLQGAMSAAQSDITTLKGDMDSAKTDITTLQSSMTQAQADIALKANAADVYTKADADGVIATAIENKADKATTLAGYGIADAYTKNDVYTKAEVAGLITSGTADAVVYDDGSEKTKITLQGATGTTITNLKAGVNDTDAVNVKQMNEAITERLGKDSTVDTTATNATAIGSDNTVKAGSVNSTAVGKGNEISGESSTAIGNGLKVHGKGSGAFGDPTVVIGDNDYSVGNNNYITANDTFVLGSGVGTEDKPLTAQNSVVLGNGSFTTEDNTVSVGRPALTGEDKYADGTQTAIFRKIVNVADGEYAHDAATYGQLVQTAGQLGSQIDRMGTRISKVGAGAAALAAMHPVYDPESKLTFSAGVGNYKSETAAAVGLFYRFDDRVMLNFGASVGNDNDMYNMGLNFALGRHTPKGLPTKQVMYQQLVSLQTLLNEQKAENAAMKQENNDMRQKMLEQGVKMAAYDAKVAAQDVKIEQLTQLVQELLSR